MPKVGIFTAEKKGDKSQGFACFGCDDNSLLAALYQDASRIAGQTMKRVTPEKGMRVRKIGEVCVEPVEDGDVYVVQQEKVDTDRTPGGADGDWEIQSLIFSKDTFTLEQAKQWLTDSENFGDYGVDETDTSYRFRQYDPEYFSEFRTASLADGISAVYGQIGKAEDADEAEKMVSDAVAKHEAVRTINRSLMKKGVRILCGTATTNVAKFGDGEEVEERYVLSMVLEPNDGENGAKMAPDTQGDIYSAEAVRKAAHVWMENYGAVDLMHNWKAIGKQDVRVLECYIAPVEFKNGDDTVQKGSWMLALRIVNDDLWEAVKSGELGAYSIGGTANRVPLENA